MQIGYAPKRKTDEVISKVIQKMAKMSFAKSCKGQFALAACKVTGACPAAALCEGGKTLPLSDRSEGALTILRSFEIASYHKREIFKNQKLLETKSHFF